MHNRQSSPSHKDCFLYVVKDNETRASVLEMFSKSNNHMVLLYPDVSHGANSRGESLYKACFMIDSKLLVDKKGNLIEASMGNHKFSDKGRVSIRTPNYVSLITTALQQASTALVQADLEVPQLVKDRLACKDMQETLKNYDAPRYQEACRMQEEKTCKDKENAASEKTVNQLIAEDVVKSDQDETAIRALIVNDAKQLTQEEKKTDDSASGQKQTEISPNKVNPPLQNEVEEVIPPSAHFPPGVSDIVLEYVDRDLPNKSTTLELAQYTLFGRPFFDMLQTKYDFGSMVLRGEERDVEIVLNAVWENPKLLNRVMIAKDPLGTPVRGTLIQLAAMAGDFDFRPNIRDEKKRGLVERLVFAGRLRGEERVAKELECVNSEEAKAENKARIERYVAISVKFRESIRKETEPDIQYPQHSSFAVCDFALFQPKCQVYIDEFEKALLAERSKEVRLGFIFDPKILAKAIPMPRFMDQKIKDEDKLFISALKPLPEKNPHYCEDYNNVHSDLFWVYGFGKLQRLLGSRDSKVIYDGIDRLIPRWEWRIAKGESDYITPRSMYIYEGFSSKVGNGYYVDLMGKLRGPDRGTTAAYGHRDFDNTRYEVVDRYEALCQMKERALNEFYYVPAWKSNIKPK